MTKLQRRLLVLSMAILAWVGPVVIMGSCTGWNEGTMQVASCTVNVWPLPQLANLFYGVVLFSSFMLGIPILVYLAVTSALLANLNRRLRRAYPDSGPPMPWSMFLALTALPGLIAIAGVGLAGRAIYDERAAEAEFDLLCKDAVETITKTVGETVDSVYFAGPDLPGYVQGDAIKDGWLSVVEVPSSEAEKTESRFRRHALYTPSLGKPVDELQSRYGVFSTKISPPTDRKDIAGVKISVKNLATNETLATTTYLGAVGLGRDCSDGKVRTSVHGWGGVVASDYSYLPFLIRTLNLKQRTLSPPQPESKPARPRHADAPVRSGTEKDIEWTLVAETDNSVVYLLTRNLAQTTDSPRSVWQSENFTQPAPNGVASIATKFVVDCSARRYNIEIQEVTTEQMREGVHLWSPRPSPGYRMAQPGSVEAVMMKEVCGAAASG